MCHVHERGIAHVRYDIFALHIPQKTARREKNTLKCYNNDMHTHVKVWFMIEIMLLSLL